MKFFSFLSSGLAIAPRQVIALSLALVVMVSISIGLAGTLAIADVGGDNSELSGTEHLSQINDQWKNSAHAQVDVNCSSCHLNEETQQLSVIPDHETCRSCHDTQVDTFLLGKHGIRLNEGLSPLTPAMAHLPMKAEAKDLQMNCNTCHNVHSVDTVAASVNACLTCHNDKHSLNYANSKHSQQFLAEGNLVRPSTLSVTCSTCHLQRESESNSGAVYVNHNNTYNLLPRDRMVSAVCMNCHGMEFSYNSIFDDELVEANFARSPQLQLETIEMVRQLEERRLGK